MKKPYGNRKVENGFSLLELIITCALLGIVAAAAIPTFSTWLPNYRLRSASQDLLSNLQLAKLTAVKRNNTCTVTFNTSDYLVSVDANSNLVYDAGEEILVQKQLSGYEGVSFDTSQGGGDGIEGFPNTPPSVAFLPNGIPTDDGKVYLKNTKDRTMIIEMSAAGNIEIN